MDFVEMNGESPRKQIKLEEKCTKCDSPETVSKSSDALAKDSKIDENHQENKENNENVEASSIDGKKVDLIQTADGSSHQHHASTDITSLLSDHHQAQLTEMQIFILGFRSCARETIRYLIEDEGLSSEDPIVVNLQDHLKNQEKMYIMQCLAATAQTMDTSQLNLTLTSIDSDYGSANDTTNLLSITTSGELDQQSTATDMNTINASSSSPPPSPLSSPLSSPSLLSSSSLEPSPCPSEETSATNQCNSST